MSVNSTLSPAAAPLTMSSRDIAELTGKDHRHVLRDLDVLRGQLGDMFAGSAQTWTHPQNSQRYPEYVLDSHAYLVYWALHKAFSQPDSDGFDPQRAATAEATFTGYFGARPDADTRRSTRHDEPQVNIGYF